MPEPDAARLGARLDAALDAAPDARLAPDGRPDADPDGASGAPVLDALARDRLIAFVGLLAKWNRVWNLTAVRDPLAMLDRHVLDALTLVPFVDAELGVRADAPPSRNDGRRTARVGDATERGDDGAAGPAGGADGDDAPDAPRFDLIDVGSGAGLPVLVLAIARPGLACLSIERTSKKARFQRQAAIELGLGNVAVRDERVETVAARAPLVTSRAFAAPADFLTVAAPLAAPGGAALVMLGRAERLPQALPAGWTHERTVRTDATGGAGAAGARAGACADGSAGQSPERHVALCRRRRIPYDRHP